MCHVCSWNIVNTPKLRRYFSSIQNCFPTQQRSCSHHWQAKFWKISLLFPLCFTHSCQGRLQSIFMWELYSFVNCNHRLVRDMRVQQKSVKSFCENQLVLQKFTITVLCISLLFVNCILYVLCISNVYSKLHAFIPPRPSSGAVC